MSKKQGTSWKPRRFKQVAAGIAVAAIAAIGVGAAQGGAHASTGWNLSGKVSVPKPIATPTAQTSSVSTGWGNS